MNAGEVSWLERTAPAALLRREGVAICLVAWVLFVSVPLANGGLGLSWDALNHHIYLGWTAQQHRFDRDFLGAGYQSFEFPYLNWPLYEMAAAGWSGAAAGAILASLHVLLVWPVWMVSRACMPGTTVFDVAMRVLAVALAFLSGVALSALGSTINDALAAVPLVWAFALAMEPVARAGTLPARAGVRYVALSGLCAGVATAAKLSNGPLAVFMPALWLLCARGLKPRVTAALVGCATTLIGFAATYGYWGWVLWEHFGDPIYPFYDHWFAPLRAWLGWTG